jgi:4-diphosphocytidyl-2-C-methyl-D-erythritol kinase
MILFPNAKINIGLNILRKRSDGYHELESLFFPIGLKDALEFVENDTNNVNLSLSGIPMDVDPENNIVLKAYRLLAVEFPLPGIDIHLHKVIPYGAGLGGGSSDAAFFVKALNDYFELKLSNEELKKYALKLGADCSFFIENVPALATGIGEILQNVELDLRGYYLLLVKPPFGVVTKEAYANITPTTPHYALTDSIKKKAEDWRGLIKNDFEPTVFQVYPEIEAIKKTLLDKGAFYASMSGSGSSVYGLFKSEPELSVDNFREGYFVWKEVLKQ